MHLLKSTSTVCVNNCLLICLIVCNVLQILLFATFAGWVVAFQKSLISKLVTTTNGLERQHEHLKYTHLSPLSNGSLADVMSVIIKTYVPRCQRRYFDNLVITIIICSKSLYCK